MNKEKFLYAISKMFGGKAVSELRDDEILRYYNIVLFGQLQIMSEIESRGIMDQVKFNPPIDPPMPPVMKAVGEMVAEGLNRCPRH